MFSEAQIVGDRAINVADRVGDPRARAYARASKIICSIIPAPMSLEEVEREGQLALNDANCEPDGYIENWVPWVLFWDFLHRTDTGRARSFARDIVRNAREQNDPHALGLGPASLGWPILRMSNTPTRSPMASRANALPFYH